MKWIYILILLVVAASTLGCVDKNQTETSINVSPGESTTEDVVTPASEDLFETESNLSAIDSTFNDMNMEITLLDSI